MLKNKLTRSLCLLTGIMALASCGNQESEKQQKKNIPQVDLAKEAPEGSPIYGFWEAKEGAGVVKIIRMKFEPGFVSGVFSCGAIKEKTFTLKATASIKIDSFEVLEDVSQTEKINGVTCNMRIHKTKQPIRYKVEDDSIKLTSNENGTSETFFRSK